MSCPMRKIKTCASNENKVKALYTQIFIKRRSSIFALENLPLLTNWVIPFRMWKSMWWYRTLMDTPALLVGSYRDIKDTTVGTLSQRITNQVHGLKGPNSKLLTSGATWRRWPPASCPSTTRSSTSCRTALLNLLPDVSLQEFVKAFYLKTNDQMVVDIWPHWSVLWLPCTTSSTTRLPTGTQKRKKGKKRKTAKRTEKTTKRKRRKRVM